MNFYTVYFSLLSMEMEERIQKRTGIGIVSSKFPKIPDALAYQKFCIVFAVKHIKKNNEREF